MADDRYFKIVFGYNSVPISVKFYVSKHFLTEFW